MAKMGAACCYTWDARVIIAGVQEDQYLISGPTFAHRIKVSDRSKFEHLAQLLADGLCSAEAVARDGDTKRILDDLMDLNAVRQHAHLDPTGKVRPPREYCSDLRCADCGRRCLDWTVAEALPRILIRGSAGYYAIAAPIFSPYVTRVALVQLSETAVLRQEAAGALLEGGIGLVQARQLDKHLRRPSAPAVWMRNGTVKELQSFEKLAELVGMITVGQVSEREDHVLDISTSRNPYLDLGLLYPAEFDRVKQWPMRIARLVSRGPSGQAEVIAGGGAEFGEALLNASLATFSSLASRLATDLLEIRAPRAPGYVGADSGHRELRLAAWGADRPEAALHLALRSIEARWSFLKGGIIDSVRAPMAAVETLRRVCGADEAYDLVRRIRVWSTASATATAVITVGNRQLVRTSLDPSVAVGELLHLLTVDIACAAARRSKSMQLWGPETVVAEVSRTAMARIPSHVNIDPLVEAAGIDRDGLQFLPLKLPEGLGRRNVVLAHGKV